MYNSQCTEIIVKLMNVVQKKAIASRACVHVYRACADPEGRGGQGVRTPPPLKNYKNIGYSSNTGPDPLKKIAATKPAFNVGPSSTRQRNVI